MPAVAAHPPADPDAIAREVLAATVAHEQIAPFTDGDYIVDTYGRAK